ncbi:MAG: tRNA preQ1(34) S-adenosylmethionine ribosyltransferase-isomerase QueA [Planctomycetota bacterium]
MRTDALDFHLPDDRIAVAPADPRDSARLLVCDRQTGEARDHHVRDLPALGVLAPGDVMAVNRTRVAPARFCATRQGTGGKVEGLYLGPQRGVGQAGVDKLLCHSGGRLVVGDVLTLSEGGAWRLERKADNGGWLATFLAPPEHPSMTAFEALARVGQAPLPPYILKARKARGLAEDRAEDAERYNTVYAGHDEVDAGSAAAPTAGLHFTPELLEAIETAGVTRAEVVLQVGLGTFAPVRSDLLDDHPMHAEWFAASAEALGHLRAAREAGGKVLAIGTTTVRALESLPDNWRALGDGYAGQTDLFIRPDTGFAFRFTDALLTNFHLPRSTLLAMVAALPGVGLDRLLGWYRLAIERGYRFYSFGDAMLIV